MRLTKLFICTAALSLVAFGLTGCGEDSATGYASNDAVATSDEAAIGMIISEDAENFGIDAPFDEQAVPLAGKSGASGAPIESFFFLRLMRTVNVTRDIHIEHPAGQPPVAEVTVTRDLEGIFRLFYDDPDAIYLPGAIDKPLDATATRRAVFVKRNGLHRHRGWRLVEVSGVEMVSNPTTKAIESLEINSASVQMVITDPLALMQLSAVPAFQPNEDVTLTVTTTDETDYVFLHAGGRKHDFEPQGGGVFQGTWMTGDHPGRRRAAVDVIDEDTLFDDEAAYDSVIWGFNYRILGEEPGDEPSDPPGDGGV